MQKYLKPKQDYIDQYDRYTVEQCRRTEELWKEKEPAVPEDKDLDPEELARTQARMLNLHLYIQNGERALKKEKTIQEWMDADRTKDELLETAQAPEDIRCLTCRNRVKPTLKELISDSDKSDRVLFMYDCPNKCLPRRAFFSDGDEWRPKPNPCPKCHTPLTHTITNTEEKMMTSDTCPACSYSTSDEYVWTKEDPLDKNFPADRDRFCLTEEEGEKYREEQRRMEGFIKMMEEWKAKDKANEERLKEHPEGFHLEGAGYKCPICGDSTPDGDNWYDQWGVKCLVCQKAIDVGEIPRSLAKDTESWYSSYDLQTRFNLRSPMIRKWIRNGTIQARTITKYGQDVHCQIFLIEDNKDFLPPKKLTENRGTRTIKDDTTWYGSEPWYNFEDPKEYLKGYGIVEYIKMVNDKPPQNLNPIN